MAKLVSVGGIIDGAWETYRAGFVDFMSVSGWLLVVALLNVIALVFYPLTSKVIGGSALTAGEGFGVALYWAATYVATPVLTLWIFLATARIAEAKLAGRSVNRKLIARESWRLFLPAVWIAILVTLILCAAFVVGFGPGVLVGMIAAAVHNGVLGLVSTVFLAVGTIVAAAALLLWSVSYSFAGYSLALDGNRGLKALAASKALVQGRFWSVLWRMVIPNVAFIILGLVVTVAFGFISSITLSAFTGLNLEVLLRLKSVMDSIFPTLIAVLLNPIIAAANVILYKSLKG